MGSSQSKKANIGLRRMNERESIANAIVANKRQRKILLNEVRRGKKHTFERQQPALMYQEQPMARSRLEQQQHHDLMYYASCQSLYRPELGVEVEAMDGFRGERGFARAAALGSVDHAILDEASSIMFASKQAQKLTLKQQRLRQQQLKQHRQQVLRMSQEDYIQHTYGQNSEPLQPTDYVYEDESSEKTTTTTSNGLLYMSKHKNKRHKEQIAQRNRLQQLRSSNANISNVALGASDRLEAAPVARQLSRETLVIGNNKGLNRRQQRAVVVGRQSNHHQSQSNLLKGSQSSSSQYSSQLSSLSSSSLGLAHETVPNSTFFQVPLEGQGQPNHNTSTYHQQTSINNNKKSKQLELHHQINRTTNYQQKRAMSSASSIEPRSQKGLAYSEQERKQLALTGLLPAAYQDQNLQVRAVINFIERCQDELSKYVYLRSLKDFNERLFYATITQNVEKLMPLVYTPTVGLACQKFSEIYMRPRGLFITINDAGRVGQVLANWAEKDVRVIVVTDGERILGLGDLGANGMGISIGKLSLYTALAGIPPQNVLPITIDVGTNNEAFLKDPYYIGLRQNRVRGEKYDALIEEFMEAVVERWGRSCLIQFEDFANATAFDLLQRFRNRFCTFNDDIQGTASVCLSGLISAAKLIGRRIADCSFLFYGAGEANLGTANLLQMAMLEEGGLTADEAKRRVWLIDSKGLVVNSRTDLNSHKRAFAQEAPQIKGLEEIIEFVKPVAIIGASAQGGAFNESICRKMASYNERPIIFALSNPTSKAECTAAEAYTWTSGKCVFASGSPFDPVVFEGKTYITGQGNNAYIFPAVGLAAIAAHVHTIPEDTFLVAARALSDQVTASDTSIGLIYPRLTKIRECTLKIASRVLEHFYSERLATYRPEPIDKMDFLRSIQYDYRYEETSDTSLAKLSLNAATEQSKVNGI